MGPLRQDKKLLSFVSGMPRTSANVYRFYLKDDYYVNFDHAYDIVQRFFSTETALHSSEGMQWVNINHNIFAAIIRTLLLEENGTVETYQVIDKEWGISRMATPGNLVAFENILFDETIDAKVPTTCLVSISRDQTWVIIANAMNGTVFSFDLDTKDFDHTLIQLESLLMAEYCRHVYKLPDKKEISTSLEQLWLKVTTSFLDANIETVELLKRSQVSAIIGSYFGESLIDETQKLQMHIATLLAKLQLPKPTSSAEHWKLMKRVSGDLCLLPSCAVEALNILPTKTEPLSLYNTLKTTKTPMGGRLLQDFLMKPLTDVSRIKKRQMLVGRLIDVNLKKLSSLLRGMGDVEKLALKIQRQRATLKDIQKMYIVLYKTQQIIEHLEDEDSIDLVEKLSETSLLCNNFKKMVETAITVEANEIVPSSVFSEGLRVLEGKKRKIMDKMERIREDFCDEHDLKSRVVKIDNSKMYGYCLKISRAQERKIRDADVVIMSSKKTGVHFTTTRFANLKDKYAALEEEYQQESSEFKLQIRTVAASYSEIFITLAALLAELDVFVAFATFSSHPQYPMVCPDVVDSDASVFSFDNGRHAILERNIAYVPNNLRFEKGEREIGIITGVNAGGKSSFIRTSCLIILLAQIGCFVPCSYCQISPFDAILTRIGASDSLRKHLSTFLMEMTEVSSMLQHATNRSFLCIDELGRGTSSADGYGISRGVIEYLSDITRPFCLFATHFHELTVLDEVIPTCFNLHVEAEVDSETQTMKFDFKVRQGTFGKSLGVVLVESIGFPEQVISTAYRKLAEIDEANKTQKVEMEEDEVDEETLRKEWALRSFAGLDFANLTEEECSMVFNYFKSA
ncbi:hypothetical protein PCE1_002608 [Barthelona sp. PCE]